MEEMKPIDGFENYSITKDGRVWSSKRGIWLKPVLNSYGYLFVNLYKDGKCKGKFIHRLIAEAYIDNPQKYPQINHRDENKLNNSIDNLEWCTLAYNNNYGTHQERSRVARANIVGMFDIATNKLIKTFVGTKEASVAVGGNDGGHIRQVCRGERKQAFGYGWRYLEKGVQYE